MRTILFILPFFFLTSNVNGQDIKLIKTDQDCLKFIRNHIEGQETFYFDTIFSSEEAKKLRPAFKPWQVFDFNNDKKPDLFYIGKYKDDDFNWTAVNLYFSENGSYKLTPLTRGGLSSFRPLAFVQHISHETLLIIHQYYSGEFIKVDDLLAEGQLDRNFCKGDDTLIYKYNSIINFTSKPSNIDFDSLILKITYGWSCQRDSFIVYKNGTYKYYNPCGMINYKLPNLKYLYDFEKLKYFIKELDSIQTVSEFYHGGTDNNAARLTIYSKGQTISFYDYGMESSFTLKSIYEYLLKKLE